MKIQSKLQLFFVVLGLVSIGITGWLTFITARSALEKTTFERLTSIREAKKSQIEQWFRQRRLLVADISEGGSTSAVLELNSGGANGKTMKKAVESFETDCWKYIHRHDFSAILLLDRHAGRIICGIFDSTEFGSSIGRAPFRSAQLELAVRRAVEREALDTCTVLDFSPTRGMHGIPVALLAMPLRSDGVVTAVLVAAISIRHLNSMMTSGSNWHEEGLGESGETYIVGEDSLMRNDSRFFVQEPERYFRMLRAMRTDTGTIALIRQRSSTVLLQKVSTESSVEALNGISGARVIEDYRGVQVISAFSSLQIPGVNWVILAEIDTEEAFRSIVALRERLVLFGLATLLAGLVVAVAVARSLSRPILRLASAAEKFGAGQLGSRATVESRDEFGMLANTFNSMADRISRNTTVLESEIAERRKTEAELTSSRESLRKLSGHLVSVREEERKAVARDMHDELGQSLTTLKLELRLLKDGLGENAGDANERVTVMARIIDSTLQTVKRMITDLRPRLLDDLGLPAAIDWQASDFSRRTGIPCRTRIHPSDFELDAGLSVEIFRIIQEALTNAARHSGASEVVIHLERDAGAICLEVSDNGRGMHLSAAENPESFGLLGIRERTSRLGGTVAIDAAPGKGTRLRVSIPYTGETG